ncbi:MAG: endonuclease MutS2 [Chloroflexota bacterium]|nr:endonuclease MutS2 [Chloroflexota bacterium]
MDAKHLATLEFPKVTARLATYASFSAGAELTHALTPATDLQEAHWRVETTSEARILLETKPATTLGGAHDVRPLVTAAQRGAVLPPPELLDVRDTLVAARNLHRTLSRLEAQFPNLAHIAGRIQPCPEVVEEINRCLDERGNVRDNASPELARIRREVRVAHDRIQDKLQNIVHSPHNALFLQEPIITQREGRYVIPLKADFKGRIRGVVHDASASGATIFIEPLSVVELNNAWRELQLKEQQEVHRILAHLSNLVAESAAEVEQTVEALAALDLAFAKAKYADDIDATAPELIPFHQHPISNVQHRATIRLFGARHPLLDPATVVPINVVLDDETHVLIITGPNTGGKTVSLKTVGLLTLMAQAGLHIPVEHGSALSLFEAIYADIGDEQSIEQNLSTFSSHLNNITSFLDQVGEHSLVLLDELGAGTDPAEGAALARALLDHFRHRGATTFVATHYPELKTYAQLTPGVRNACVEFDPETLSPTYRLTIGLPGRSNAFAIAQRLGLPRGIIGAARKMVSPADLHTENMLADIHRLRIQTAQARDEANEARTEAQKLTRDLRERLSTIEQERQEILERAREETTAELERLRVEVRGLRRRLQTTAAPLEAVTAVEEAIAELESTVPEPEPLEHSTPPGSASLLAQRTIRPGDTVWVRPLNAEGQVTETNGDEAEVLVGQARIRVRLTALELRTPPPSKPEEPTISTYTVPSPGVRLDLRGCTSEEALQRLDRYLDTASRAGLPWVRVIHGKGTGALRQAVRSFLTDHPLVSGYKAGDDREGGAGVTIAKLVL